MENLFSHLVSVGVRADDSIITKILGHQNPHYQKRGGLGFGIHGIVTSSNPLFPFPRGINSRINPTSSLELRKTNEDQKYEIYSGKEKVASMQLFKAASWINEKLKNGKFVAEILQQHTARNLVGVLGNPKCPLFISNSPCSFCDMQGGKENIKRTRQEILESLEIILSYKKDYILTFTTPLFQSLEFHEICSTIEDIKKKFSIPVALECQPLQSSQVEMIRQTGLDTIMIPMDCYSSESRSLHIPGKKLLLERYYWQTTPKLVKIFGAGNVISNLIVGLENIEFTRQAIDKMIDFEIIPDLLPLRPTKRTPNLETNPEYMNWLQEYLTSRLKTSGLQQKASRVKAGCAACGGCSAGFTPNMILDKKIRPYIPPDPGRCDNH